MRTWRVVRRSAALAVVTGAWALAWGLGLLPARLLGAGERWRAGVFSSWARAVARVIGMRIEREGAAPAGRGVLLVSNHLSYLDIVLIASQMRCVFLSKAEVASWPVFGVLARWMETLFVERERRRDVPRVAAEIRARLERGQSVVFFPEGTSTRGDEVGSFRSALLEPAAREGLEVRYAALRYFTPPGEPSASEAVCWWGDMDFAPHLLALFALSGFRARIAFGEEPIRDLDRKALARRLHGAVAQRFTSLMPSEESCPIGV